MNILCTICARGGSKGVKSKNTRILNGKPLIVHTIEQAKKWGRASHIIISTDSESIADISKKAGAEVPFMRPAELATDTSGKLPVLSYALYAAEEHYKTKFDVIMDLDPTAPIRKISDLNNCLELFLEKKPDSLFSAVVAPKSPYFNMVEVNSDGYAQLSKKPEKTML
jgi:CMP-N-acetylneuraminic acid synthetase